MKRYRCVLLIVLLANLYSFAQQDSLRKIFPVSHGTKKWKPAVGFDAFRSFYSGAPVKFNGLRIGLEYKGVHRFGFGFYGLKKDLFFNDIQVDYPLAKDTSLVKFKLNYAAFFYERVFYKTRYWEISLPAYLGGGGLDAYVEGSDGIYYKYYASSFSLINLGMVTKFYPLTWFALRLGVGQRFTFNSQKDVRKAFNGPFYSYGFSILFGELYKVIFPKTEGNKHK